MKIVDKKNEDGNPTSSFMIMSASPSLFSLKKDACPWLMHPMGYSAKPETPTLTSEDKKDLSLEFNFLLTPNGSFQIVN